MLKLHGDAKNLDAGRAVHLQMITSGYHRDRYLCNLLIQMYGRCRSVHDAIAVFHTVSRKNVFTWTILIVAHTHNGLFFEAVELFREMDVHGVQSDEFTFSAILEACSNLGLAFLSLGKTIHSRIHQQGLKLTSNPTVICSTAMIDAYAQNGHIEQAAEIFERMQLQGLDPDLIAWTAMMTAYNQLGHAREALLLFRKMDLQGLEPDRFAFVAAIDACSSIPSLEQGTVLHSRLLASSVECDGVVGNALLNFYAKAGLVHESRSLFSSMKVKNVVTWSAIVAAYAQNGHHEPAVELFREMLLDGIAPNKVTIALLRIVEACDQPDALDQARELHTRFFPGAAAAGDVVVATALVNMYGRCGSVSDAKTVFDEMQHRNITSWNAMLVTYSLNQRSLEALRFFRTMLLEGEGVKPDAITFVSAADACGMMGDLSRAVEIHSRISQSWPSNQTDVVLGSALIKMYGNCRSLAGAAQVLDEMPRTNVISWTSMILACEQNEDNEAAIHVYRAMQLHGHKPDPVTMVTVIKAAANLHDLKRGIEFHAQAAAFGFATSTVVGNALVTLYGTSGDLQAAENVFKELLQQSVEDVVTWNSMLSAWNQNGLPNQALRTFQRMLHHGRHPDKTTFVNILNACAGDPSKLLQAVKIHALAAACGLDSDTDVANTLLHMYSRCGNLSRARKVFHAITQKNVVSWSAMAAACAHNGDADGALQAFRGMLHGGIQPNAVTFISILSGCSHTGLMDEAVSYLYAMSSDHNLKPTVQHYACLLDLLARAGKFHRAEELATHLPNPVAWNSLLGACLVHGDAETAARAADTAAKLQPLDCAPYVSLSNAMSTGKNLKTKLNYFQ
ncbi:hypothetical protein SELMODRAFT_94889 [Selaginella moellendorffii]|uniref:Pentacotripeptide-repeat region of PRORP domain-containing protein n=1 Tax=Selaginella moellendorffii TaxID=88036 RepID=D8RJ16_SELML|nr:hypothetical protein SELMODRAFT_94889 [Selaginella moellendorffii]